MFFGDMGGNFYVLDVANGQKLWGQKIGGAIAGGVITYTVNGTQKIAAATGLERFYGRQKLRPQGSQSWASTLPPRTNEAFYAWG